MSPEVIDFSISGKLGGAGKPTVVVVFANVD